MERTGMTDTDNTSCETCRHVTGFGTAPLDCDGAHLQWDEPCPHHEPAEKSDEEAP
jgi:hypothetical protein